MIPPDLQAIPDLTMTTGARADARGRALGAVGGKPPRTRGPPRGASRFEPRSGEGGVGGAALRAFPDYLFEELSVHSPLKQGSDFLDYVAANVEFHGEVGVLVGFVHVGTHQGISLRT